MLVLLCTHLPALVAATAAVTTRPSATLTTKYLLPTSPKHGPSLTPSSKALATLAHFLRKITRAIRIVLPSPRRRCRTTSHTQAARNTLRSPLTKVLPGVEVRLINGVNSLNGVSNLSGVNSRNGVRNTLHNRSGVNRLRLPLKSSLTTVTLMVCRRIKW